MNPLIYIGIAAAAAALWGISAYNRLVRLRVRKEEGWSGVLVQLKRRHDLVPNLAASARGLAEHEKGLQASVAQARSAQQGGSLKEVSQAEGRLSQAMGRFIAVAEAYPEIKADSAFNRLMGELSSLEGDLQLARRYYNGTVRDYNLAVQSFPSSIVAGIGGFQSAEFFELGSAEDAEAPSVAF